MTAPTLTVSGATATPDLSDLRLGLVCPMANEAATAVRFVDAVLSECERQAVGAVTLFAILDTASSDSTKDRLESHALGEPRLRVVWAPETRGVADAYVRGYREALTADCDWILEIDAGFSHDPGEIGRFLAAMAAGNDCVFGSRFQPGGRNRASWRRRVISRGGTALTNLLLGTTLSDMTSGYQMFTRGALEHVLEKGIIAKGPFFQTEIKTHCRTLRVAEIPIQYDAGSHRVRTRAITESLVTLARLFLARLHRDL